MPVIGSWPQIGSSLSQARVSLQTQTQTLLCSRLVLLKRRETFFVGSVRGVRGSRPPPSVNDLTLKPGLTLVKGEDLLRQLEQERRQLRKKSEEELQTTRTDERPVQDKNLSKASTATKQQKDEMSKSSPKKKTKEVAEVDGNQFEVLNKIICPLLDVPYDDQLEMKTERHVNLVRRLSKFSAFVRKPQTAAIVKSDVLTEYRSKDEFGIQRVSDFLLFRAVVLNKVYKISF